MIKETPTLNFTQALDASVNKIFQITGRSRRSEFWWTKLVVFAAALILTPFAGMILNWLTIPLTFRRLHDTGRSGWWCGAGIILQLVFGGVILFDVLLSIFSAIYFSDSFFAMLLAGIMKYRVIAMVLSIYQVVILIFCCLDSQPHDNRYGASPKYVDEQAPAENQTEV